MNKDNIRAIQCSAVAVAGALILLVTTTPTREKAIEVVQAANTEMKARNAAMKYYKAQAERPSPRQRIVRTACSTDIAPELVCRAARIAETLFHKPAL